MSYDVDAIQLTPDSIDRAAAWVGGVKVTEIDAIDKAVKFVALNIPTIAGVKRAQENDYVVKYPEGRIDVMGPAAFNSMFRPV